MPVFTLNGVKLESISEVPFNLEMDIQKIVEGNMKTIFGLEYITSEFILNDLLIDTLGFDEEEKSFVIIEFKRDKFFSYRPGIRLPSGSIEA